MSLFGYIIIIQGGVNMSDKQHYLPPNFIEKFLNGQTFKEFATT